MYFLFVNKTYNQITTEQYGFKMQNFIVLFSEVRKRNGKSLCSYDLTSEIKPTLRVSVGFSFTGWLI